MGQAAVCDMVLQRFGFNRTVESRARELELELGLLLLCCCCCGRPLPTEMKAEDDDGGELRNELSAVINSQRDHVSSASIILLI